MTASSIEAIDFSTAVFEPVGRCIYCGDPSPAGGLREEHIVAFCLGGVTVLPAASCRKCEDETHAFEGATAHHFFRGCRFRWGFPSRRPKERPTHLPLLVGKSSKQVLLAPAEYPVSVAMYHFSKPGLLLDRPPSDTFAGTSLAIRLAPDFSLSHLPQRIATLPFSAPMLPFLRTIAKIAHAMAVADQGIDGFVPYLPKFILNRTAPSSHLIGCSEDPAPEPTRTLHQLRTEFISHGQKDLLMVRVRLFAYLGTPEYWVIAGEPTNATKRH